MTESGIFTDFPKSYFVTEESVIYFIFYATLFSLFINKVPFSDYSLKMLYLDVQKKPASFLQTRLVLFTAADN